MHEYLMFALALSPLLLMVFLILKLKMPIHYSVLISLVFTAALSAIFWEMPVQNLKAAIGYGALKGLWPIVIVILGAIFSYNVMQATKALDILRDILASISEDKRIQVLLISWCFGGFLEAAAGYGTAVAIPIGILIALGFNPLKAAIASLVANTVPTAFGAVGIPVSILAEQVNLPVYTLGGTIILQLALFNILLPFVIVCIIGGGLKAIRGVFLITLICGISTLIPQYFVAIHLGAELPAFAVAWSACLPWRWSVACAKGKPIQSGALRSAIPAKPRRARQKCCSAWALSICLFLCLSCCVRRCFRQ